MIVASTGIVIFISANTTGILANIGPDEITSGVTGVYLVSDWNWELTVAQGAVMILHSFVFSLISFILMYPPFLANLNVTR